MRAGAVSPKHLRRSTHAHTEHVFRSTASQWMSFLFRRLSWETQAVEIEARKRQHFLIDASYKLRSPLGIMQTRIGEMLFDLENCIVIKQTVEDVGSPNKGDHHQIKTRGTECLAIVRSITDFSALVEDDGAVQHEFTSSSTLRSSILRERIAH